jgi:PAS domain S-box-containing protein
LEDMFTTQESLAVGYDGRSEFFLKRVMLVCIAITAVICGIAIVGWELNIRFLTSFGQNYVPMAPASVLGLIMLSSGLFVYAFIPTKHAGLNLARSAAFLVLLFCSFTLVEFFAGIEPGIEQSIFHIYEKFGYVSVVRMSPFTSINLILAAFALLLLLTNSGSQHAKETASVMSVLVGIIGSITTLGYLYGTPLLYGGTTRPMAFMAAIAFIFLGGGLIAAAGPRFWPLSSFMGSTTRARLLRVFLPLVVAIVLIEGWLIGVFLDRPYINTAMASSLTAILFMIIFGSVINRVAQSIGGSIDRANFEKERAFEALHESENRYRRLFETARDGILILDADTGKITDVNPFLINILGYSYGEFLGKQLWEIGSIKDIEARKIAFSELQTKDHIRYEDLPLKTKDGRSIDFEFVCNVYQVDNNRVIQCNIRDITQRKQMDEELKKHREHLEELVNERTCEVRLAKEEAEHANMAKTNFLQTMSHELRTPLNAILGFSELLKLKTSGELNEKQERFVQNIITGGNNLLNIIRQILDVVKMYEGTLELHIENIPVPETLDEIIGVIKEKATKKNVLLEKNLDPELKYIEGDKQKFKQVLNNLIENAVKFSKEDGGTVTINAKKDGDNAKFSVSDRGIGIKEEDIEEIFHEFTQLDSGTDRKYGGAGIGLAITKKFVELHGGRMWAQSKFGEGSTFTFLIPLRTKEGDT